MKFSATIPKLALAAALALGFQAGGQTNAPVAAAAPATARDFYNAGTKLLAAKKFVDAEKMFESALAAQDERVRPAALYNVGHGRFSEGLERLEKGPDAQKAGVQGRSALAAGAQAIHDSELALAGNNVNQMTIAYFEGRGARHDLRDAEKAVSAAMETYGKTLDEWLRSADDFKGVAELNPAATNAVHNAETVERGIARLIDSIHKMQEMMGMMGQQRQQLGKMLSKLKGQIPGLNAPPGGMAGDTDEDDDTVKPDSLAGKKETESHGSGQLKQPTLSPDQANEILNGLSLDGTRRLEMSNKEGTPPKDRQGRNW
jgi:tetratricopeptide (TPR) repeat protein